MNYYIINKLRLPVLMLALCIFNNIHAQKNAVAASIVQDGKEIKIKDGQTVTLKRDGFTLLFNSFAYTDNKSYATQIDAFTDVKGISMIKPSIKVDSIPYFAGGTGMACAQDKEYECMYIDKDLGQHHYIMYADKDRRAKLEGKSGDTLRLSWDIKKVSFDQAKKMALHKSGLKDLYMVIFNDFNLNGIVDAGEYQVVHIVFE